MKKIKQWSLKSVAEQHGYLDSKKSADKGGTHHVALADWLENNFYGKKPMIVDIGCGNARVLEFLDTDSIGYYTGYDVNEHLISFAKEKYKNIRNADFVVADLDSSYINFINDSDIAYIDSVLTMLENPYNTLKALSNSCKHIFINRTQFFEQEEKTANKWGGMEQESVLWRFSAENMKAFAANNGLEFLPGTNNTFILSRED
jgi:SAM-dependent methyltransferase